MAKKFSLIVALFVSVFLTMMAMWLIKKAAVRYEIPIVQQMAKEV